MINYELEEALKSDLNSGEKLIWTGKPKKGIVLRSSDFFLIPFSLLWGGFALFWESTVLLTNSPLLFKLWGIPFVLIGLYLIVGRFFVDAIKRSNTVYGLTDDRIIIKSEVFRKSLQSLNIYTLSEITLNEKRDGTGTITLGPPQNRYPLSNGLNWPGIKNPPMLEFIEEVKVVYNKIIQLQKRN